jgi:hypothetical protein
MNFDIQRLIRKIRAVVPQPEDAARAMTGQLGRITSRTLAGQDVQGDSFKPLKDGSPSNLRKTGLLQRSIKLRINLDGTAEIYVDGPAAQYAPYVDAKRHFMGISDNDQHRMLADFTESINERLRRA